MLGAGADAAAPRPARPGKARGEAAGARGEGAWGGNDTVVWGRAWAGVGGAQLEGKLDTLVNHILKGPAAGAAH